MLVRPSPAAGQLLANCSPPPPTCSDLLTQLGEWVWELDDLRRPAMNGRVGRGEGGGRKGGSYWLRGRRVYISQRPCLRSVSSLSLLIRAPHPFRSSCELVLSSCELVLLELDHGRCRCVSSYLSHGLSPSSPSAAQSPPATSSSSATKDQGKDMALWTLVSIIA